MTHRFFKVTSTPQPFLTWYDMRASVIIQARSTNMVSVFISEDPADVVNDGIELLSGDSYSKIKALGDEPEKALWAQTSGGTAEIVIVEQYFASERHKQKILGEI